MRDAGVGIADVIRAITALRPNAAGLEAVVEMCGHGVVPELATKPRATPPDDDEPDSDLDADGRGTASAASSQALPPSALRLKPVRQGAMPIATQDPLGGGAAPVGSAPTFEGLLTVRDAAELLRFAASVPMLTEAVDVDRVAEELAHARPLTELPRLRVPSLALGAQALVDVGESMEPFLEDQQQLLQRFENNLRARAEILYFADDPELGAGPDRRKRSWKPYGLPESGTPVIALTDLGCGFPRRAVAARAWVALAERLRRRGSRLVVFAPVRLERIPPELRRAGDLVFWDRSAVRRNVMQLAGVQSD
jgi:hypothetical protein